MTRCIRPCCTSWRMSSAARTRLTYLFSVCGELAGDLAYTRLLLGLGLRQFSMNSAQLLGAKQRVLTTSLPQIAPITQKILRAEDPLKTRELLDRLNAM